MKTGVLLHLVAKVKTRHVKHTHTVPHSPLRAGVGSGSNHYKQTAWGHSILRLKNALLCVYNQHKFFHYNCNYIVVFTVIYCEYCVCGFPYT